MNSSEKISVINHLKNGGVGVLATDTLYGIVGSALNQTAVEKIYNLRKRDLDKPMIILIPDIDALKIFDISLSSKDTDILKKLWPNKVSVILSCNSQKFEYLHRGTNALAFRVPKKESLRALLKETSPLVAPSANTQGEKPAETIAEAKQYFGDEVDFYLDEGFISSEPSTIVSLHDGAIVVVRKGAVEIPTISSSYTS